MKFLKGLERILGRKIFKLKIESMPEYNATFIENKELVITIDKH